MGLSQVWGTSLCVPMKSILIYWGLYVGQPIYGNYHLSECCMFSARVDSYISALDPSYLSFKYLDPCKGYTVVQPKPCIPGI